MTANRLVGFGFLPVFCLVGAAVALILLHTLDVKRHKRRLLVRLAAEIGLPLGGLCWLLLAWRPLPGERLAGLPDWAQGRVAGAAVNLVTAAALGLFGLFAAWRIRSVLGWRRLPVGIGWNMAWAICVVAIGAMAWGYLPVMAR